MQCVDCSEKKSPDEFYKRHSRCKKCVKLRRKLDYNNDKSLSRLEARVGYTNAIPAIRRLKNFMKRYQ